MVSRLSLLFLPFFVSKTSIEPRKREVIISVSGLGWGGEGLVLTCGSNRIGIGISIGDNSLTVDPCNMYVWCSFHLPIDGKYFCLLIGV